jgi:hypothetical protein
MSIKLNDAQLTMLSVASQREDRCLAPPPSLRSAQMAKTSNKLIAAGLVREVKAKPSAPVWRRDGETGSAYALKLTSAGIKASAAEDDRVMEEQVVSADDAALPRTRAAAQMAITNKERRSLSARAPSVATSSGPTPTAPPSAPAARAQGEPRPNSKIAAVIAMLTRPDGATLAEMVAATGWLPHTTRAALTGLRKRGYAIAIDRSDRQRGSVYRADPKPQAEDSAAPATAPKAA